MGAASVAGAIAGWQLGKSLGYGFYFNPLDIAMVILLIASIICGSFIIYLLIWRRHDKGNL